MAAPGRSPGTAPPARNPGVPQTLAEAPVALPLPSQLAWQPQDFVRARPAPWLLCAVCRRVVVVQRRGWRPAAWLHGSSSARRVKEDTTV